LLTSDKIRLGKQNNLKLKLIRNLLFACRTGNGGMWKKKDGPEKNTFTSPNDGSYIENYVTFVSERWSSLKSWFNNNFERLFSFKISDVSSFEKFVQFLYRPTDPASLGVARALFGEPI